MIKSLGEYKDEHRINISEKREKIKTKKYLRIWNEETAKVVTNKKLT